MSKSMNRQEGKQRTANTATAATRAPQPKRIVGHASLGVHEKEILGWSHERRLAEFQKVNKGFDAKMLEAKLLYIDSMTIDNGEILDALRTNSKLTWEMVRDMFLGGPINGYTSTFHGLEDVNYPEHFWKATIENEREKLIRS